MTYTTRIRGGGGGLVAADYRCPDHGLFDEIVDRATSAEPRPCPACGQASERALSAPMFKPQRFTVVKGKPEAPRSPMDMDTTALADGMPFHKWKEQRAAMWRDHDLAELKAKAGIS